MNSFAGGSVQPGMNRPASSALTRARQLARRTPADLLKFASASMLLLFLLSCSDDSAMFTHSAEAPGAALEEVADYEDDAAPEMAAAQALKPTTGSFAKDSQRRGRTAHSSDRDIGPSAGGAIQIPADRLLEYKLTLQYRTEDHRAARRELLKIANEYGHLLASSASTDPQWNMNTSLRVRASDLYAALEAMERLGELEYENIQATDHTEGQVLAERQSRRALQRVLRRKQGPTTSKAWAEREQLISQGEEQRDAAEHEQWRIRDRVKFAQIDVSLLGPDLPTQITVPPYHNAGIILLNGLLELIYAAILGIPLWLLFGLLWWQRGRIAALFNNPREAS